MRASSITSRRGWPVPAGWLAIIAVVLGLAGGPVAAQDVTVLESTVVAVYVVDLERAAVDVTFTYEFTNTATDSAFTGFFESLPQLATDVAASASGRELEIGAFAADDGFVPWLVLFPDDLNPDETIEVTLEWSEFSMERATGVTITPGFLAIDLYSGGTDGVVSSVLTIDVPARFESLALDGFESSVADGRRVLTQLDPIPYEVSNVIFEDPDAMEQIALADSPQLTLSTWRSQFWVTNVEDSLEDVLPVLDGLFGERTAPLEIRQQLGVDHFVALELDRPQPFVRVGSGRSGEVAHKLTHAWLVDLSVAEDWVVEGLAAVAATAVGDPALPLSTDASFVLADWTSGIDPLADEAAIALAAEVMGVIAADLDDADIRAVVDALRARTITYPGVDPDELQPIPSDWRTVLDGFANVGGVDASAVFRMSVISADDAPLLDRRDAARVDYLALEARSDDWVLPPMARFAMASWDFETFASVQGEVSDALLARDSLRVRADVAELDLGPYAQDLFESAATDMSAVEEIQTAQAETMEAVVEARRAVEGDTGLLAWVGLLGSDPDADLRGVLTDWDAGRYEAAADASRELVDEIESAVGRGTLRILAPTAVLGALWFALSSIRTRRRKAAAQRSPAVESKGLE